MEASFQTSCWVKDCESQSKTSIWGAQNLFEKRVHFKFSDEVCALNLREKDCCLFRKIMKCMRHANFSDNLHFYFVQLFW